MIDNKLSGANLIVTVSEPEDFFFENGEGPFNGTIVSEQAELIAIKLDESLSYKKTRFTFMVASARHENTSKEDLLNKGKLFVNLVPVLNEKKNENEVGPWIFNVVRRWRGGHLIGDLVKR